MGLFKPAWQSGNKEKAMKAVVKETDEIKLAEIAKKSPNNNVRNLALQKITDQNILYNIAIFKDYNLPYNLAVDAIKKITDQTLLIDIIAKTPNHEGLKQIAAIENLTDQNKLIEIAKSTDYDGFVRMAAIDRINDEELTTVIMKQMIANYKKTNNDHEIIGMINKTNNQTILIELAQNNPVWTIREAAAGKLTDQEILTQIAKNDRFMPVRTAAAKKLTNKHVLKEIQDELETNKRNTLVKTAANVANKTEAAVNTKADNYPVKQTFNELSFITQSLKNSQKITLKGVVSGTVIMTPKNTQITNKFPRDVDSLYEIHGLNSGWRGDLVYSVMNNPLEKYIGDFIPHDGFPAVCLKCGKPMNNYTLLVALVPNNRRLGSLRLDISANDVQGVFDALRNTRHFFAIPRCDEHYPANKFYFKNGTLLTNDKDIADIYMKHKNR